jgi:hypothetical protein
VSTIKIRISGESADLQAVLEVLAGTFIIVDRHGPYRNRKDPGVRWYLDIVSPATDQPEPGPERS